MGYLIKSNLYVSICCASLYTYYALLLKKDFFLTTPLLVFALTFLAYNFLRLVSIQRRDQSTQSLKRWYLKNKLSLILISLFLIPIVILGLLDLNNYQLLIIFAGFMFVILYERFFFKKYSLRTLPYLKPVIIAITWALVCVGLHIDKLTTEEIFIFIDAVFFIFILSLLFDYKDLEADRELMTKSILSLNSFINRDIFFIGLALSYLIFFFFFITSDHWIIFSFGLLSLLILALRTTKKTILFCFIADGIVLYKALFGFNLL